MTPQNIFVEMSKTHCLIFNNVRITINYIDIGCEEDIQ